MLLIGDDDIVRTASDCICANSRPVLQYWSGSSLDGEVVQWTSRPLHRQGRHGWYSSSHPLSPYENCVVCGLFQSTFLRSRYKTCISSQKQNSTVFNKTNQINHLIRVMHISATFVPVGPVLINDPSIESKKVYASWSFRACFAS